jgi:hypothetical protein
MPLPWARVREGTMEQPTGDRTQHFPPIAKYDAQFLQILISEIGEDGEIDAVLGEAPRVLRHAELVEPVRNLLHCGALSRAPCDAPVGDYPNRRL